MSDYDYYLIAHTCSSQEITRVMKEQDATIKQLVKNDKLATVMINQAKINNNAQRDEIKRLRELLKEAAEKLSLFQHSSATIYFANFVKGATDVIERATVATK